MQTLTCQAGHEWTREAGRGRPPKCCPEHASAASQQAAVRHQTFYVPRPARERKPNPPPRVRTTQEMAAAGRAAASARWAKVSDVDRSAHARELAATRWGGNPGVSRPPVVVKSCPFCGSEMRGANRKQCGDSECRRRYHADRQRKFGHERRARIRGNGCERFEPREIYDRDGWVCRICSEPVDLNAHWPDPDSVSLDHIIPVSLGGPHTRENTRCAHFGCNSKRGNRAA